MCGILTFITDSVIEFITESYVIKVSHKLCHKVGNESLKSYMTPASESIPYL